MTYLLERPGVLLSLLLACGLGIGGTLVHLTTPTPKPARRAWVPAPAHMCPSGVSDWNREHNQFDDDED